MMRPVLLALLASLATPVFAADHPFVGVYYAGSSRLEPAQFEQARRNCAWSFSTNRADGTSVTYLLNREQTDASGKPVYDTWISFACSFVADPPHDACKLTGSPPDREAAPPQSGTIYDLFTPELVDFRYFDDPAKAKEAALKNDKAAGYAISAVRCPFTEDQVKPFLSGQYTTLTIDTWTPLILPKGTPEENAHMDKVLSAIGVSAVQK